MEGQCPLGDRVPSVKNLRHNFVAEIQCLTGDSRLGGINKQAHEGRRSGRLALRFTEFRYLVELSLRWFLVDLAKEYCFDKQNRYPKAATPTGGIRSIAQFGIINVIGAIAADVLLRNKIGRTQ